MAFQNFKPKSGLLGSKFVGLDKFKFLFEDATFIRAIRNTFCMGALNLLTTTVMAILFAVLLNEIRSKIAKKTVQTISFPGSSLRVFCTMPFPAPVLLMTCF